MARYEISLHSGNQLPTDGTVVTVHAENPRDAVQRALAIGWFGNTNYAHYKVLRVDDVPPTTEETDR